MEYKDRIKQLRERTGMSQKKFADMIGVSQASVGYWERGERLPSTDAMQLIAHFFDVPVDELLDDREINIIESDLDDLRKEVADLRYSLNEKGLRKVADYMYDLIEIKKYKIGN